MDKASTQLHVARGSHTRELVEAGTEMRDLKEVDFPGSDVEKEQNNHLESNTITLDKRTRHQFRKVGVLFMF